MADPKKKWNISKDGIYPFSKVGDWMKSHDIRGNVVPQDSLDARHTRDKLRREWLNDNYRKNIHTPYGAVTRFADPTGVLSYQDVSDAWGDGKFTYKDITEPLGALPAVGYIPKAIKLGLGALRAADFGKELYDSTRVVPVEQVVTNGPRGGSSNNTNMKKQYCHGGKMYFLGSDLSFGDAVKQNPGIATSAAGMVGAGIDAVDKPSGSMIGSIGKGAASGAAAGMMLGPWGAAAGAVIGGGLGALQKKKADEAEAMAYNQASLTNYAAGTQGIDPSMHNYRLGGPLLTEFNGGGTHEQNPNGGIPQGVNGSNGEPNLVENDETKSNAPGSKNYIFPARTIFADPKLYNLGGNLAGLSFADASKKIAKYSEERPNDPIATKDYELKTSRLKQANEDEIAMTQFQNQNPRSAPSHFNSKDKLGSQSTFKYGGFLFKDI